MFNFFYYKAKSIALPISSKFCLDQVVLPNLSCESVERKEEKTNLG